MVRIKTIWHPWRAKRRERMLHRYMVKRSAILNRGLHLYADVQDCYDTQLSITGFRLIQLRLSIPIKDSMAVVTASTAFIKGEASHYTSKRLRIRFLPGDLSHIVITG